MKGVLALITLDNTYKPRLSQTTYIIWYIRGSFIMNSSCSFVNILFSFLANKIHLHCSHIYKQEYMNIHECKYQIKLNTVYFSSKWVKTTITIGKKPIPHLCSVLHYSYADMHCIIKLIFHAVSVFKVFSYILYHFSYYCTHAYRELFNIRHRNDIAPKY